MGKHLDQPYDDQPRAPIWRTKVTLSAVLMLAVIVATIFGFRWLTTDQPGTQDTTFAVNNDAATPAEDDPDAAENDQEATAEVSIIVHVAGEVEQPGIVELADDARVIDAIEAAGGPTQDAQLDVLNLAAAANDGDYIMVPDRETADLGPEGLAEADGAGPPGAGGAATDTVNINTADAAGLETLPGIGPATASQIIAHREQHGAFADLASLEEVSGIGPATRERLDGLVTW